MGETETAVSYLEQAVALDPERVKARAERDEALEWALERL
jgi:hypothetical protein